MTATARLRELRARQWDALLDEHPEHAISVGYPTARAWTDWTDEGVARRQRGDRELLALLEDLDEAALGPADRVDRQVAVDGLRRTLDVGAYRNEALTVDQVNGPQVWIPNALADLAPTLAGDAEPYLERLAAVPEVIAAMVGHLRRGAADGITLPRVVAALVPPQIDQLLSDDALAARFVEPLAAAVPGPSVDRAHRLAREVVAPALGELADVYREEYLPAAGDAVGLGSLPDGEAWYAALARWYTTTDLSPAQLQELGRAELATIGDRMATLAERLGAAGVDVDEPGAASPAALVAGYDELCRRIDARLPELFATLPALGFEVVEMPAAIAREAPAAYYVPGSARAGRPGRFQVNTSQLASRPRREAVALAMHECIPGHHLQFALAQENDDLAPIRRHAHVDAYIEGWALYAESLAADLGLFDDDPLAEYGALTFAAWRAARLVVDPGLHVFGWTRDQAIDFMVAETARPRADLVVEVDRYIAWPGQALGYKVGELAIRELRGRADAAGLDRRAFHDQVLGHGAIPLAVLDEVVGAWIGSVESR